MNAQSILAKLRANQPLSRDEIVWFANGLADGVISDAQAGAFAMAVCTHGLGEAGRVALTTAMRDSGSVMEWNLSGPVLDKHSTGGLGDAVSLVLTPCIAACGAYVPMISGRGLGHTGGTLDKLEAIPGLKTEIGSEDVKSLVADVGCAIVSATLDIAPSDKRLYSIRDVTSTVDSTDLITASILSKKLAGGLDGLVLDVKAGSGAFMTEFDQAHELALALVGTANGVGCPSMAVITDMNQPLAPAAGNAVEMVEVMRLLTGEVSGTRMEQVCVELGSALLVLGGLVANEKEGAEKIKLALSTGKAAEIFGFMVSRMGGPLDFVSQWADRLPAAAVQADFVAKSDGFVTAMDARKLGHLVIELGGGRKTQTDEIDMAVGLSDIIEIGQKVTKGDPIVRIHAQDHTQIEMAKTWLADAIQVDDTGPAMPELILGKVH